MWRIFTKNIAIASGVTSDGRNVQGIGVDRWSADGALDAAVEDIKRNARDTDFSFRISALEGGYANVRIEFLEEQGIYRTQGAMRGLTKNKTVEINASKDGRTVSAKGSQEGINREDIGFGNRGWPEMLTAALDSARSRFDRVGTTSMEG
jgi:hypothetical protein